jgi:hypothetical protein
MNHGNRTGRMKPCLNCGEEFYCAPSSDVGGTLPEQKYCGRPCYYAGRNDPKKRQEAFWAQVEKEGHNGCWIWTGWKLNSGYGETTIKGRKITVHRLAFTWANGEIPKGKLLMHSCDVPLCVNPEHLSVGTDAENHADMRAKGRHPTKLTPEQVQEIKRELLNWRRGMNEALASKYGVSPSQICMIRKGRQWKHINP